MNDLRSLRTIYDEGGTFSFFNFNSFVTVRLPKIKMRKNLFNMFLIITFKIYITKIYLVMKIENKKRPTDW